MLFRSGGREVERSVGESRIRGKSDAVALDRRLIGAELTLRGRVVVVKTGVIWICGERRLNGRRSVRRPVQGEQEARQIVAQHDVVRSKRERARDQLSALT